MADLSKTVEIIFGGKNELTGMIGGIEKDFDKLNHSISKIADPFAKLGESVLKIDAALAALVIGGMALAVREAGNFSDKFGEISTLLTETGAPVEAFKQRILEYSTSSVKSIDEINNAIYSAISAGVDYKNSVEFVSAAEKLSVAGRSDLGATTVALISTLNAYGEGTNKAGKYSDIMFQTVRLGQTTMEALSTQLAKVTGLAANAGVPFETLSAAVAALTVAGLPTEQALTSIKAALTNIIKPSGEAQKMASALGIQFNASALQTKGFEGVLADVYKATGGNTEKMAQLFGSVEALNGVMILGADKTGKFKDSLIAMKDAAGSTQEAYAKVVNSFENVNQRLANSFKVMLVSFGQEMVPGYLTLATTMTDLFKNVKVAVDAGAFDDLFALLDRTGATLNTWLQAISEAFPEAFSRLDFSGLIRSFENMGDAFASLFSLDDDAPQALADAMQLVIDSISSLVDVTKGMGEIAAPFINFARITLEAFNKLDTSTKEMIGNLSGLGLAFKAFGPIGLVIGLLGTDSESTAQLMNSAFAVIQTGVYALKTAFYALALVFAEATLGAAYLLDALPGYDNTAGVKRAQDRIESLRDSADQAFQGLVTSSTKANAALFGAGDSAEALANTLKGIPAKVETEIVTKPILDPLATEETKWKLAQAFFNKDQNQIELYTTLQATEVMKAKAELAKQIPEKRTVDVEVLADGTSIQKAYGLILEKFPDGSARIVQAQATLDKIALDAVKKKVDDAIPPLKTFEIQAKLDEAKIKGQAEIIQKSIEWKAKLDIADVEANAKIIEAAFKSIDNTITSTGETLSSIVGTWATVQGAGQGGTSFIEEQIRQENIRREAALDMQKDLTTAEVANLNARTKNLLAGGSAMITVNGAGLQPHLEAFMFEILSAIQIRANAEGQKFLVGA